MNPASTPQDLDLEGEDLIEVRYKPAEPVIHKPTEPHMKKAREIIPITIQGKAGKHQFRVYKVCFFSFMKPLLVSVCSYKMYSSVR
jgi:hypothetical protein